MLKEANASPSKKEVRKKVRYNLFTSNMTVPPLKIFFILVLKFTDPKRNLKRLSFHCICGLHPKYPQMFPLIHNTKITQQTRDGISMLHIIPLYSSAGGMHHVQDASDVTVSAGSVVAELNRKAQQHKLRPQYSPQVARTCESQSFKCVV